MKNVIYIGTFILTLVGVVRTITWSVDPMEGLTTDLRVWRGSVSAFGDGVVCKKAKGDLHTFRKIVAEYQLEPVPQKLPSPFPVWDQGDKTWWDPPLDYQNAFYKITRKERILAAYKQGYIYFEHSWF